MDKQSKLDAFLHHDDKVRNLQSPRVVRLKRSKGIVVQGCDVYIGRRCSLGGWDLKGGKWANPFSVKSSGSVQAAVDAFGSYISEKEDLHELNGKVLGCWCKPGPCHGDVLVQMFNDKYKK